MSLGVRKVSKKMDDSPSSVVLGEQTMIRKSPCRYGRGCTHINDPSHLERFRHPLKQELDAEEIRTNYMCNECGLGYNSLDELRFHLQKKTAWSNESLVGCRISCLVDCKEWHEGLVTHYHRSGKHCIEFRAVSEKRWFHMLKLAFYIIEPVVDYDKNEFKDSESEIAADVNNSNNIQKEWTYFEDISFDYAFTQSVLFKIYGGVVQETGHKTRGHASLTEYDRYVARAQKGSLLYGELLPRGVNKALDPYHLDACKAHVLFDMGMGTGKVAIQAFLQFRNLEYVYGVELSVGRYLVAEAAALCMVQLLGEESFHVDVIHGEQITVTELVTNDGRDAVKGRTLRLQCGNMMDVKDINIADIIMMETDLPAHLQFDLCILIQREMHDNARILSYHDLFKIWPLPSFPFKQLDINSSLADRFPTSWSVQRGHHFFLFKKNNRENSKNSFQRQLQRKIGRSSSGSGSGSGSGNNSNNNESSSAFTSKSPSWSVPSTKKSSPFGTGSPTATPTATPNKHPPQSTATQGSSSPGNGSGAHHLSDREYRESQAYTTAFPSSLRNETHLQGDDATAYQEYQHHQQHKHNKKEIPQLSNGRHGYGHVAIVDQPPGCGCNLFTAIYSRIFSSKSQTEKDNDQKFTSARRHKSRTPTNPNPNTTTSSSSPSQLATSSTVSTISVAKNRGGHGHGHGDGNDVAWTPKKVKLQSQALSPRSQLTPSPTHSSSPSPSSRSPRPSSPPVSSPAAQIIKIINSNSPRSVRVEQNKSPRKEVIMSSPVT